MDFPDVGDCLVMLSAAERLVQLVDGLVGIAFGFVERRDELRADDGSGSIGVGGLQRLLVADAEANHAWIAQLHLVDALKVSLLLVV